MFNFFSILALGPFQSLFCSVIRKRCRMDKDFSSVSGVFTVILHATNYPN